MKESRKRDTFLFIRIDLYDIINKKKQCDLIFRIS